MYNLKTSNKRSLSGVLKYFIFIPALLSSNSSPSPPILSPSSLPFSSPQVLPLLPSPLTTKEEVWALHSPAAKVIGLQLLLLLLLQLLLN